MAKTKPIGVRFDEDILDKIKKEQGLTSPQQVLNWLMDNYGSAKTWNERMAATADAIKKLPKQTITTSPVVRDPNKESELRGSRYNPNTNWRYNKKMGNKE